MATMEKPKQKKKKKVKPINLSEEEVPAEILSWSNADIEFPSTSNSDEIDIQNHENVLSAQLADIKVSEVQTKPSPTDDASQVENGSLSKFVFGSVEDLSKILSQEHEPSVEEPDIVEAKEDERIVKEESAIIEQVPEVKIEEEVKPTAPSAPAIEDVSIATCEQTKPIIQYPDLKEMRKTEPNTVSALHQRQPEIIQLKPFNEEQLRELYHNPELRLAETFETEFINNELSCTYKEHPLYDLIKKYSQIRYNLKINMLDLQGYIKAFQQNSKNVWVMENRVMSYEGTCKDGIKCRKSEPYEFAVLNESIFHNISTTLNNIHQLVCYNFLTNLYACETYKVQIEQSIRDLLLHPSFAVVQTMLAHELKKELTRELLEPMQEMRITISILFYFLRRHLPDKEFAADIKEWLQKVVAIYIRLATWQDHLFLIYHVLRCPAGVASWATSIIQIPKPKNDFNSPFSCAEINHCIAYLKVLLMPTKRRNEFLAQLKLTNTPVDAASDDLWIIIDSDGEEDHTPTGECVGLKENDLIALFNQVPFENLFKIMTFVETKGEFPVLNERMVTGHHLLKFIAFSSNLVQLVGEGLKTYDTERYKQFAKLLSRLVRHTVQYVSDMHAIFKSNNSPKDSQLCARIQIEYDTFVLRSSNYIYESRFLGAWQYLATLPFAELDIKTVWKLYYLLITGFSENAIENVTDDFRSRIMEINFLECLNDTIYDVPPEDMYYLLQTFGSMALARNQCDYEFINRITMDLFRIGFMNAITKENCYKIVRDLLVNITTKHNELISTLLHILKENFKIVDKYGMYLFKSLPLEKWQPSMDIFETAASWLLNCNYETSESAMARTILSRLNWGFNKNNELFLPHDIHLRMASLIVEVSSKHVPETIGSAGITESVRQVSNLVKGQTPRQQFITWCWSMVSVLRLHCFDQNSDFVKRIVRNPAEALRLISEIERLPSIYQGVTDSRPIAIYLSVLVSLWGHSVPQICHKGFAQMQSLLYDYRHSTVIRCLQFVTPFFLECPESLSKCERFQTILLNILGADRTYLRMAKDFISTDFPGPILEQFSNMIQAQITDYYNYGLQTPTMFINLWLNCLTINPNWYKDVSSLYVVDVILKIAYQFTDSWIMAKEHFKFLCKNTNESKPPITTTFLPFLGSGSQQNGLLSVPSATAPWLALIILEVEHEIFEIDTKLWPELIRQLHTAPQKFSIENIIKSSSKLVGCPPFPPASLVIYKLANLILTCSYDHPLLPIFCQKFFYLYLARIRFTNDEERYTHTYGVSDKFYEHNISLMKKLKRFWSDAEKYDREQSSKASAENQSQFHALRMRLYHTFVLWLEETTLNKIINLQHQEFPPQFDLNRLAMIFSNNTVYWSEFIPLHDIRQKQIEENNSWQRICYRYVAPERHSVISLRASKEIDPKENIMRHLQSYDTPVELPSIKIEQLLIKKPPINEFKKTVLNVLQFDFKRLVEFARLFNIDVQEISSLDSTYKEMLKILHDNKTRSLQREIRCSSIVSSNSCTGSTYVTIHLPYHEVNDVINSKLISNRDRHESLINKLITLPTLARIMPIVHIQYSIRRLLDLYRYCKQIGDERQLKEISNIGNSYFYFVINGINENINAFHPAKDLCTIVLSQLGIFLQDSQNTEGMNLLRTALKRPDLLTIISELFVPSATNPEAFLEMYKFIIDSHLKNCDPKVLFVLLSKFDVNNWLVSQKPKLSDISQLIQLIVQGLESWNKKESALIQGVLRRHLAHIFVYEFPEHYGEVLQVVLKGCSENKLMPSVLIDMLNSVYKLGNCRDIDINMDLAKTKEEIIYFATNQQIFSYQELHETMAMFARHFQHERLQHGLHGLYPIHKDYCQAISLIFETFGYSVIVSAVHTYPGALSDNMVELLWPNICEMFSPWLIPYYTQNMQNLPANWIRQFMSNTPILLPWSELYAQHVQLILQSFISCIQFLLDTFPACDLILGNIFYWYESHFGNVAVPRHVLVPTKTALMQLPWNRLKPTPLHIGGFYRLLQQYLPDCHSFLGHVFLRVSWTPWLQCNIQQWGFTTRANVLSALLLMFIKLSYEPNVRENSQLLAILQEASLYPWYLLDYQGTECVFEWFVTSTEPSAILNLNSEHTAVDNSVLNLLQVASSIIPTDKDNNQQKSQLQAKRILYVKSLVRLLRLCGSKYQQLLATPDGIKSFQCAVINLLTLIDNVVTKDNEDDGTHLLVELVGPMQMQGEFTSKLFVEAMTIWQSTSNIGSLTLNSTLNAIGLTKSITNNILMLLEATTFNYFRSSETTKSFHNPSWSNLFSRLGAQLPPFDLQQIVKGDFLLALHIYIIYKLRSLQESGEKISFLQNIHKMLENYKTIQSTEPKLAMIWGLLICCGHKLLETNSNAREPLLNLARYLQNSSNSSDNWGDGLLGAIGLKKDTISNKRRILTRCLACIIFTLVPEKNQSQNKEYLNAIEDLRGNINSKKFSDIRTVGLIATEIIENQSNDSANTKGNICSIIRLFYNECFLLTLENIWNF